MNILDALQDALETEMMHQSMYNQFMLNITRPDVRQLFAQMRDSKMQHVTQLQKEIQNLMQQGTTG